MRSGGLRALAVALIIASAACGSNASTDGVARPRPIQHTRSRPVSDAYRDRVAVSASSSEDEPPSAARPTTSATVGRDAGPGSRTPGVVAFVDSFCPSFDESCVGGNIGISRVDGSHVRLLPIEGRSPAFSPDASRIAFDRPGAACPAGCGDLYVVRLGDERHAEKIADNARSPVWSPDGTLIAFERKLATCVTGSTCSDIWTVHPDGTTPTLIIQDARAFAWSPDGRSSVFVRAKNSGVLCSSELWVGNQANDPSPTYRRMTWAATTQILDIAWSPDGERLAIARHDSKRCQRGDRSEYALYLMNVDGTQIHDIARSAVRVAWENTGDRLFFEHVNCTAAFCPPPDLFTVRTDGAELRRVRASTAWPAAS